MGSWEFNIRLRRMSGELIAIQYWAVEGVRWANGSPILRCRGFLVSSWKHSGRCPVSSWEPNIRLWIVSNGSWESNIRVWRMSGELMNVEYWTVEGFRWVHGSPILHCG